MSGYKVVPVEPTKEMMEAYQKASSWTAPLSTWGYKAMLAATPAVQGEPVVWMYSYIGGTAVQTSKGRWTGKDWKSCWEETPLYTAPQPAEQPECGCCGQTVKCDDDCDAVVLRKAEQQPAPSAPTFQLGDHVRKTKGSQWKGRVVGTYSTDLTPEGYAVESDTEKGSVQIYPVGALELVGEDAAPDVGALVEALETCLEMEERPKIIELARAALAVHRKQGGEI